MARAAVAFEAVAAFYSPLMMSDPHGTKSQQMPMPFSADIAANDMATPLANKWRAGWAPDAGDGKRMSELSQGQVSHHDGPPMTRYSNDSNSCHTVQVTSRLVLRSGADLSWQPFGHGIPFAAKVQWTRSLNQRHGKLTHT